MCGIAGIVDFAGQPIERERLEEACRSLAHRGPDDRGIWLVERDGWSAGLAHTRLAVIDPAPEAHQPMLIDDGRWAIAYNGELYNYVALRDELASRPATLSDTEVVLQACRQWGPQALGRLDGMWAMAVVNAAERVGHLSRDPFGIKPLYYAIDNGKLIFSSELRTLVELIGVPPAVDEHAVAVYLQLGYVPHPLTIYRHVRKLAPGHLLRFDSSGAHEPERFAKLAAPPERPPPYAEACERVRSLLGAAVERQCVADVPLGAFLSGGIDSSVVVACMARSQANVKTFSIGYADHARYDETAYARRVAQHLGTEHHEFRLSFADVLGAVEPMLSHLGEPFADSSLLPTSLVSKYTRQHVTVALSGDGGDELFGGYWRYFGHGYLERYRRVPDILRHGLIEPLVRLVPEARSTRYLDKFRQARKLLRGDLDDPMERHLAWSRFLEPEAAAALLDERRGRAAMEAIRAAFREAADGWYDGPATQVDPLQRILLTDLAVGLPGDMLHKVDTASMYHALEVRVPLLSLDVANYVSGLPIEYKIQGTTGKRVLRDAFRDMLPAEVFNRPKMGFEVPVGEFLRDELRDMYLGTVTESALQVFGIDARVAARAYDDHLHRRRDRTELLWSLLVLCWWGRTSR